MYRHKSTASLILSSFHRSEMQTSSLVIDISRVRPYNTPERLLVHPKNRKTKLQHQLEKQSLNSTNLDGFRGFQSLPRATPNTIMEIIIPISWTSAWCSRKSPIPISSLCVCVRIPKHNYLLNTLFRKASGRSATCVRGRTSPRRGRPKVHRHRRRVAPVWCGVERLSVFHSSVCRVIHSCLRPSSSSSWDGSSLLHLHTLLLPSGGSVVVCWMLLLLILCTSQNRSVGWPVWVVAGEGYRLECHTDKVLGSFTVYFV